jgi:histidine triad (HIT) family protein
MDCVFCKIVSGEFISSKLYEDDLCMAFMDIMPVNEGHALVIPKKHYENVYDCPNEVFQRIASITKKLNSAIKESVKSEGIFNAIMNGAAAGQEVFHLHMHIIPRNTGDGFGFKFPIGYGKQSKRMELNEIAEMIRVKL